MRTRIVRSTMVGVSMAGLVMLAGCAGTDADPADATRTDSTGWSTQAGSPASSAAPTTADSASASSLSSATASSSSDYSTSAGADTGTTQQESAQAGTGGRADCGYIGPLDKPLWTEGGLSCADGAAILEAFHTSPGVRAGDKGGEVDGYGCMIMGMVEAQEYGYVIRCVNTDGRGVFQ